MISMVRRSGNHMTRSYMYTSERWGLTLRSFIIDNNGEGESSVVSVAHIMRYTQKSFIRFVAGMNCAGVCETVRSPDDSSTTPKSPIIS
jgi:hypothetical protein